MAPETGERTTFEKNGDTDARAIVDSVAFDVEDKGLLHNIILKSVLATKAPRRSKALTERWREAEKDRSKSF